jgi:hypothetical protein
MPKKGALGWGQSQVYERCVGPKCEGKNTPARKLIGLQAMDNSGGRINFYPVCKDCETTSKANAQARKLPPPVSHNLTKEAAYVYREQLDAEARGEFKNLKKKVNEIKPGTGNRLAPPENQNSSEIINPDPHGRMEHYYFAQAPHERELTKRDPNYQKRSSRPGDKRNKELDEMPEERVKEPIGQRPLLQKGTAKLQKRLTEEQKGKLIEQEAAVNERTPHTPGPYTELSPRTTKSGKKSRRTKDRTTWIGNPDPGTRRPTKQGGDLWKSDEKITSVQEARLRAADPTRMAGNLFKGGVKPKLIELPTGKKVSLDEHLGAIERAQKDRHNFELLKKEKKRGKKA